MPRLIALLVGLLTVTPPVWAEEPQVIEVEVTGMTCPFCVYGTEKKLTRLPSVAQVQVSLKSKKARIHMTPGAKADIEAIRKAILDAGFTPGEVTLDAPRNSQ
jgi:copper chaperone CopZ